MKVIAYLINQYPMTSLTFIRREIAAVEAQGVPVRRYAVRAWDIQLVDPEDLEEAGKTRRLLDGGLAALFLGLIGEAISRPRRFVAALLEALRLGKRAGAHVRHLVYLAEAARLRRWTLDDRVEHLHVHFGTNSASVALLCRVLGGPPYSFVVHGPEEFDQPVALALDRKIRYSAFTVAISQYGRSQLWRWADPEDWPRVKVVHCGLGSDYLDQQPAPPTHSHRFINIGRLSEQKGQLLLVDAAARLRDEGRSFEVAIIGGGPLLKALERKIELLSLRDQVQLLGWRNGQQVRDQLISARALVLPSFAEGLPVVIMESLALGRPVVSTYVAGIPELVRPGESGWLVPAGSVDDLANAMRAALDATPEEIARMGLAGRERVLREHDARLEARRLLALINQTEAPE